MSQCCKTGPFGIRRRDEDIEPCLILKLGRKISQRSRQSTKELEELGSTMCKVGVEVDAEMNIFLRIRSYLYGCVYRVYALSGTSLGILKPWIQNTEIIKVQWKSTCISVQITASSCTFFLLLLLFYRYFSYSQIHSIKVMNHEYR